MTTTISAVSSFTNGKYTSTGSACANNYVVIPITWTGLDGYPEVVVETAIEDVDASYHPAKMIDANGNDFPIKLRLTLEDGGDSLTIDSIYSATPFVRIVVYDGGITTGSITFTLDVG